MGRHGWGQLGGVGGGFDFPRTVRCLIPRTLALDHVGFGVRHGVRRDLLGFGHDGSSSLSGSGVGPPSAVRIQRCCTTLSAREPVKM